MNIEIKRMHKTYLTIYKDDNLYGAINDEAIKGSTTLHTEDEGIELADLFTILTEFYKLKLAEIK